MTSNKRLRAKIGVAAATFTAAAGLAVGGFVLSAANATTLTCTNIAGALVPGTPAGCGGAQSAYTTAGLLDLSADSNNNNAVIRAQADSQGNSTEDFTAYAVGGIQTGSVGDLGRYVAMYTPDGRVPSYTVVTDTLNPLNDGKTFINSVPNPGTVFVAGPTTHCISVVSEFNGPIRNGHHLPRWNVILRNCNSNGEFTYGTGAKPGSVTFGFGNAWQEWAPVADVLPNGTPTLEFVNVWLFNLHNVQYTLNITGFGGAGTHLIAFPNTNGPSSNEEWGLIGCTAPASTLASGIYANCP